LHAGAYFEIISTLISQTEICWYIWMFFILTPPSLEVRLLANRQPKILRLGQYPQCCIYSEHPHIEHSTVRLVFWEAHSD